MRTFTPTQELKFYIFANGIRVTAAAKRAWARLYGGPMSLSEYASTSGIALHTIDGVYMNAPFIESFTKGTKAVLRYGAVGFFITWGSLSVPVTVIPVPAYHQKTFLMNGIMQPYTNLGVTHTDRVRISPVGGCAWRCRFCNIPYEQGAKYRLKPMEELLNVILLAVDDALAPARHVLISGGTPYAKDESWIDEVYAYIAANSPIPVDVMMPARADMDYPAQLFEAGVNMVSINVEVIDPDRAKWVIPSKHKILGLPHYLDYIARCVEVFGVGRVQSLIVFGGSVEPLASSLLAVREVAIRGGIPVLSPFRPDASTPMGKLAPATEAEMRQMLDASIQICEDAKTGVKPGPRCGPCAHNTDTFDDGSDFYVGLEEDLTRPLVLAA